MAGGGQGVDNFSKDISSKANVVPRLEFELAYHDVTANHVNHHAIRARFVYIYIYIYIYMCVCVVNDSRLRVQISHQSNPF